MTFVLDPEQEADAQRIAAEPSGAALDASEMSGGKTAVACRVAKLRQAQTVLIVAPLGTRTGWEYHVDALGLDLPFRWIRNTKAGKKALALLQFDEPGVYFIGRQYLVSLAWDEITANGVPVVNEKGKKLKRRNKLWENIRPDLLVIDEAHLGGSNRTSQTWKVYKSMSAGFRMALSGTWMGNFFDGAWAVSNMMWPEHTPKTFKEFKDRFAKTEFDPWAYDKSKIVGERNPGEYANGLPCVVRRKFEHDIRVDESNVYVELSAQQRKAYTELERNMVTFVKGNPIVVEFPPSLRIRLRQASLGLFSIQEDGSLGFDEDCPSSKLDALKTVLKDDFGGESALILTDSQRFARVATARLNSWFGEGSAEEWSGRVENLERDEIKQRFIDGGTRYIVMVIAAGGTGVSGIQFGTRNMVWLSQSDDRVSNEQAAARVIRRGVGDLVRVRRILAVDTFDVGIMSNQIEAAIQMNRSLRIGGS